MTGNVHSVAIFTLTAHSIFRRLKNIQQALTGRTEITDARRTKDYTNHREREREINKKKRRTTETQSFINHKLEEQKKNKQ